MILVFREKANDSFCIFNVFTSSQKFYFSIENMLLKLRSLQLKVEFIRMNLQYVSEKEKSLRMENSGQGAESLLMSGM